MNHIITVHCSNLDQRVLDQQAAVVEKFRPAGWKHTQLQAASHADGMYAAVAPGMINAGPDDIILFLDADAIPLSTKLFERVERSVRQDFLFGPAQDANHIEPIGWSPYAGPCCLALTKALWKRWGRPPFEEKAGEWDVAEAVTWAAARAEKGGAGLMPVMSCEVPKWLVCEWVFGLGTTYGFKDDQVPLLYHCFEIRHPENVDRFLAKCEEVLANE